MKKNNYYTDERHAQIVLSLLKQHGIRKIVTSPGATNIPVVASVQNDDFFEVYSCVDERSAAYMACGLAEASKEPVVISCTGATASRNYMSGLTEAFYRKLPIVALTSFNGNKFIGNLLPQNIDRTVVPNDVVKLSVQLPVVKDKSDEEYCNLLVNKAILETRRHGGGPVHINLTTTYSGLFTTKTLPKERLINRYTSDDELPDIDDKKIAIFIGSIKEFSEKETELIEEFCASRNAVVLCDHTSGYRGMYRIQSALVCSNLSRINTTWKEIKPEVVFHLGEVSGDYPSTRVLEEKAEVWRVSEDGEIRDRGGNLRYVYEGSKINFFEKFKSTGKENKLFPKWKCIDNTLREKIPSTIPFSNPWIASSLSKVIPNESYLNLAILNSLRSWNYFELPRSVISSSNVGGFGIDGCLSTTVGASLANKSQLCFSVVGDLAFFYDVNVVANRHLGSNVRILLINNGCGTEFNNSSHLGATFGDESNRFISAGGHFGAGENGSCSVMDSGARSKKSLAQAWAEQLGIQYLCATSKVTFEEHVCTFIKGDSEFPILFECFTNSDEESVALDMLNNLNLTKKEKVIKTAKEILPPSVTRITRKIVGKAL
ncbi:thiamine pyrophosphate-binding protein [Vibrio splendidus]|uniref:thiamine pyrophosphate-binding protein n=1 Tax=Vibrio splendidus TaxID=29497 RepID=UPI000D3D0C47|nr:thiamine pyrophosphate-binding protein [Vibrio splendidus]PTO65392.1 2-succinyl-5-enolpyruvyl-6-hydroxy-3-cyclohexene-1-carboxylate synthase [Vibrio splendidus]